MPHALAAIPRHLCRRHRRRRHADMSMTPTFAARLRLLLPPLKRHRAATPRHAMPTLLRCHALCAAASIMLAATPIASYAMPL